MALPFFHRRRGPISRVPPLPAPVGSLGAGTSDPDTGISWRMLLAAALLRRGDDIASVAAETGVPVALLELVSTEVDVDVAPLRLPPTALVSRPLAGTAIQIVGFVAIANVLACVVALLHHVVVVGVFTAAVAVALTTAIRLLGMRDGPRAGTGRAGPQRPQRRT